MGGAAGLLSVDELLPQVTSNSEPPTAITLPTVRFTNSRLSMMLVLLEARRRHIQVRCYEADDDVSVNVAGRAGRFMPRRESGARATSLRLRPFVCPRILLVFVLGRLVAEVRRDVVVGGGVLERCAGVDAHRAAGVLAGLGGLGAKARQL